MKHQQHQQQQHFQQHLEQLPAQYTAIYFGDSEVDVGEPFAITCRIAITEPVQWLKDGDVIVPASRRHRGKDDYALSATQAEGVWLCAFFLLAFFFIDARLASPLCCRFFGSFRSLKLRTV